MSIEVYLHYSPFPGDLRETNVNIMINNKLRERARGGLGSSLTVCDVASDDISLEIQFDVEQLALHREEGEGRVGEGRVGEGAPPDETRRGEARRLRTNLLALWLRAVAAFPKASSSVPAAASAQPAPRAPPAASATSCTHTRAHSVLPAPLSPIPSTTTCTHTRASSIAAS